MNSLSNLNVNEYLKYGLTGIVWILVILYIVVEGHKQNWHAIITLVGVFIVLYLLKDKYEMSLESRLIISVLAAYIISVPSTGNKRLSHSRNEAFTNPGESSNEDSDEKNDSTTNDDEEADTENFDSGINIGRTFLEAYKSLTPDQIESMTNDAKDLIQTQKSLVETIKALAPVVVQGREMLTNFKDYFGEKKEHINKVISAK